jgi:hypothetical protein
MSAQKLSELNGNRASGANFFVLHGPSSATMDDWLANEVKRLRRVAANDTSDWASRGWNVDAVPNQTSLRRWRGPKRPRSHPMFLILAPLATPSSGDRSVAAATQFGEIICVLEALVIDTWIAEWRHFRKAR